MPTPLAPAPAPVAVDPLARVWPLEHPEFLLRVDVAGLRARPLGQALERGVAAIVGQMQSAERARCVADALGAAKEIVFGTAAEGWVAVARYDATRLASPRACFDEKIALTTPAPGVVVFGTAPLTERAAEARGSDPLAAVALSPGQYARAAFRSPESRVDASLALSDALLALRGDADVPEHFARELSGFAAQAPTQIAQALGLVKPPLDAATVDRLSHAITFGGSGKHVTFAFDLAEPAADQARDVAILADMAAAGVRKYILESKAAEARSNVHFIARSLAEWWEREDPAPHAHKTKLISFPPVPKDVPRGTTYASTPADWAAWAPLKFIIDEPQRYQYEVRAAKDGKSADIIARGDLNGDGKTSQLTLHVDVRNRSLVFATKLTETDPDE